MSDLFLIVLSAVLINNFVLVRFLGICPFIGVSKKIETAFGMSMAVLFVMTLASIVTWTINHFFLIANDLNLFYVIARKFNFNVTIQQFDLGFMRTIIFILVIATLVQFVEMVIRKFSPNLYQGLGVFLPLITTNCAVLGVALLNIDNNYTLVETLFNGVGSAIGFSLALLIMAGLREKFETMNIPESLKGASIALITAGILSICFMGFSGVGS